MSRIAGQTVKVYIETMDGVLYDLTGDVIHMDMSAQVPSFGFLDSEIKEYLTGRESIEVNLTLRGRGKWTTSTDVQKAIKIQKSKHEWICDYCRHVNTMEQRVCGDGESHGCGASRSFVYDL